jgi:phosphoribosylanthranilate isomerase
MIKVKICGIKNKENVDWINSDLPDYVGLVFAKSKRKVTFDTAKILLDRLDSKIKKVGVFVNEKLSDIAYIAVNLRLDIVQLHGDEDNNYILSLKNNIDSRIWKAVRLVDNTSLLPLVSYKNVDAFLLDSYSKEFYGGTGETFNWELAIEAKKYGRVILAGGLNPENVAEAIKKVEPYAVDVSSGVENENGKDKYKIRKFIYSARSNIY